MKKPPRFRYPYPDPLDDRDLEDNVIWHSERAAFRKGWMAAIRAMRRGSGK